MSKDTIGVGVIGLGARGFYSIGTNLAHTCRETGLRISALCDRNSERMIEVRDALAGMYEGQGVAIAPSLYGRGTDLIDDPAVDLIVITSITDRHRQYAVPALRSGKKVYCDKPLAQNAEDAVAIVEAEAEAENPLIMGFTRRYEAPWRRAFGLLTEGTIGDLTMILIRDTIPYHRYLQAWWRRRKWSGGALNDKGSHLFDVFNWFTQSRAVRAHGFGGRSVVEPDPLAPPRCTQFDRACVYRRRGRDRAALDGSVHFGESWLHETEEKHRDDVCVYAPGSDVYHNGSIHFSYENGVIASYFYSIFGPAAEDQETMELVGTKGRMILTREMGTINLVADYGNTQRIVDCNDEGSTGSHFGADVTLIHELRCFCDGAPPLVSARSGLEATRWRWLHSGRWMREAQESIWTI